MNKENSYDEERFSMKVETEEEIIEHLLKSEDDIEHGRVRDTKEIFEEWKEKYGI